MGILRSDRITGLGGANAITGSVQFFGSNYISVGKSSDFALGTGDWTVEYWAHQSSEVAYQRHFYLIGSSSSNIDGIFADGSGISFGRTNVWAPTQVTHVDERWNHYALVHDSTNMRLYINGTQVLTSTDNFGTDSEKELIIGYSNSTFGGNFDGYISNFRIENGFARYTSAFTPSNTRLTKTENTTFLGLQSSSNVLQEETGKVIVLNRSTTDSTGPIASRFTPNSPVGFSTTSDVGSQYGATFDGFTVLATSTYMVPPGGNTRERNRGRGLFGGGYTTVPSSAGLNTIYYVEIQSMGNSVDFGDLNKAACWGGSMCASSTRGLHAGGTTPTNLDSIDFVTIANAANATDFGNLTSGKGYTSAASNQTRGLVSGGRGGPPVAPLDTIDLVIIATAGNASDFGDLSNSRMGADSLASPTRALIVGGSNSPVSPTTYYASIDRVEIATAGDATDFGDLSSGDRIYHACASSSTRGLIGGGFDSPTDVNEIDFVTIASDGNSVDFGDLLAVRSHPGATSNSTRAIWAGGVSPYRNSIEFVTIATTGNASDFGDIADQTSYAYASGTSDSHGGIS